ncbi:hypothetical protein ACFCW6_10535 [Streptomyces sp. NPDC056333]|uniref:hypothetical protein n=1 Tax=Streptomyces sp. NPDC056333 TaxID=3345786 RepID=UPI0035D8946B
MAVHFGAAYGTVCIRDLRKVRLQEAQERDSRREGLSRKMELPGLVDSNRLLLDKCHIIATDQAKKAVGSTVG